MTAPRLAVLGIGEAGWAITADLVAAGAAVTVHDPAVAGAPPGARSAGDEAAAVAGADLILSLTTAAAALPALTAAGAAIGDGAVYADLNTSGPALKRDLAEVAGGLGARFTDGAIMSTVPGKGVTVPILAAGAGAAPFADALNRLGGRVTVLQGQPGDAAARKLVRSVYYKGMSAAILEAIEAAAAVGAADWLRDMIRRDMHAFDVTTLDRIEDGSRRHAHRRATEMDAATDLLRTLGVRPGIAHAAADLLRHLATAPQGSAGPPPPDRP